MLKVSLFILYSVLRSSCSPYEGQILWKFLALQRRMSRPGQCEMFRVISFYSYTFSKYFLHGCTRRVVKTKNALTDFLLLNVGFQMTATLQTRISSLFAELILGM